MSDNKIILIHYINVSGLSRAKTEDTLLNYSDQLTNGLCEHYVMPVTDSDSRVECINPVDMSEHEYKDTLQVLETNKKELYHYIAGLS